MNQAILLNNDLTFNEQRQVWQLTGFYQSQTITIYIPLVRLAKDSDITQGIIFELEDEIENWLEDNEPDSNNIIELK